MPRPRFDRLTVLLVTAILILATVPAPGSAQLDEDPEVEIQQPRQGDTVREMVNITGEASDGGIGDDVERVEVRIDNGSWREANGTDEWNLTWDTTLWDSGNHTITARAWDGSDPPNNDTDTVNVTVNQPPSIAIRHPRQNLTLAGQVDVVGSAEDPEAALEKIEVRIDDGPWQEASGTTDWSFAWNTTNVRDGNHTITARAHDGGDRPVALASVNVSVSNGEENPPSLTIEQPEEDATVSGLVNVTGTAHDPEGALDRVQVRIDDGPWETARGAQNWFHPWDTSEVADGNYTLTVRAEDDSSQTRQMINLTVDNGVAPPVRITAPENRSTVNGTVAIEGTVDASNVDEVQVRIDEGPWREANGTQNWTFEWNTSSVDDGPHRVSVRALNGASANGTASITLRVTNEAEPLDPTAGQQDPTLSITRPSDDESVETELTIAGQAQAAEGTSLMVEYRFDEGPWRSIQVTSGEPFERQIPVDELEPGEHTLTLRAADDEQTSEERTMTITVEEEGLLPTPGPGAVLALALLLLAALGRAGHRKR